MLLPVLQGDTRITDVSAGLTALQMNDIGEQRFARKCGGYPEEGEKKVTGERRGRYRDG